MIRYSEKFLYIEQNEVGKGIDVGYWQLQFNS
jgi:hypothetical protein